MAVVDEKSMVPTVLVGVGGTGHEILARVRRLVEEAYGSLANFPIISFLLIDTDKDYKVTSPNAAGSPFKDHEKYWASVSGRQVRDMMDNMSNYPWIERWFPTELERNIGALEAGAGQIRGCGRFAFFCNYHNIQKRFEQACNAVKGHENKMLDKYGIKVTTNGLNAFVVGSLSGGTGSGMIVDIGYALRKWMQGESSPLVTAIAPLPAAFAGINVGDRVLANGYAAMMELSYFSDYRTEYVAQYSNSLVDEIRSKSAPFDFIYLTGTKNGETEFTLEQLRELTAQNIFLDLTSDFAPHKRSIRDNIKGAWAQADPGGRGYPKNFMSFGLSTIEIPIAQIRTALTNRLAGDFINWWLNESALLPPQAFELVQNDILKRMRLTEIELLGDLAAAGDQPYIALIADFVNSIRQEIARDNLLQCTQQGVGGVIGAEKGKILQFVDGYLIPKVDEYRTTHLREMSPDERLHGDFFQKMYDNRNRIIQQGQQALEAEFYRIIEDRTQGPKFADTFLTMVRQILATAAEKFRRDAEQVWGKNEENRRKQYEDSLQDINHFKDKFGLTKQAKMEEYCGKALEGLQGSLTATIQRKARFLGLDVIARLQEHLDILERKFARLNMKLRQARDEFRKRANEQADSADALVINGIKLYDREELNGLYQDLIEQSVSATPGNKSRYDAGMDAICTTLAGEVLAQASPLWKQNRTAGEVMRLFDLPQLQDVQDDDWQEIVKAKTQRVIENAPNSAKLKRDLAACDRLFQIYTNDEEQIRNQIRIAYDKSKPLIQLSDAVMKGSDAGFTPAVNSKVAIVGGRNATEPAAIKLLPFLTERVGSKDSVTPLGEAERHRLVFVQEIGGFSLRCINGMREIRQSYQDWKGQTIEAKRAQLRGESKDPPIPVHIQKEPPFWDIFPDNPEIYKLVVHGRALQVLRVEQNRRTKENVIRYTRKTAIGTENVDIASTWEEAVQVLEVLACRPDREEIQRQVIAKLDAAETTQQKQQLSQQLMAYLQQRQGELEREGGKDSLIYKREAKIIEDIIESRKLPTNSEVFVSPPPVSPPPVSPTPVDAPRHVFCTNCGTQNPANSKFCYKCGSKLAQV
ncbi:tubulin-like doman-containing protein [[Phormidium] sp. ETS-05]|uniref:tubulin-like doman-containing protein n=1 Tax=[Phormidium] sp. ETS-05 TaxID=222819 RepID=UPI0018EED3DF|nr:tubulin-like doman-containing protein [[Phormidium] sp. ETS-05]